jgi:hypothetical protein
MLSRPLSAATIYVVDIYLAGAAPMGILRREWEKGRDACLRQAGAKYSAARHAAGLQKVRHFLFNELRQYDFEGKLDRFEAALNAAQTLSELKAAAREANSAASLVGGMPAVKASREDVYANPIWEVIFPIRGIARDIQQKILYMNHEAQQRRFAGRR